MLAGTSEPSGSDTKKVAKSQSDNRHRGAGTERGSGPQSTGEEQTASFGRDIVPSISDVDVDPEVEEADNLTDLDAEEAELNRVHGIEPNEEQPVEMQYEFRAGHESI